MGRVRVAVLCVLTACAFLPIAVQYESQAGSQRLSGTGNESANSPFPPPRQVKHARRALPAAPKPIFSIPKKFADGHVALSFDIEAETCTPQLLNVLEKHGVRATFFICGTWAKLHRRLLKEIAEAGHEFGNHSSSHRSLPGLDEESLRKELRDLENLVLSETGKSTKPWLRPPYGAVGPASLSVAADEGYDQIILWNVDAKDAARPKRTKDQLLTRLLRARPGSIILMHNLNPAIVGAVDEYLSALKKQGRKAVAVSELLQIQAVAEEREERIRRQKALAALK